MSTETGFQDQTPEGIVETSEQPVLSQIENEDVKDLAQIDIGQQASVGDGEVDGNQMQAKRKGHKKREEPRMKDGRVDWEFYRERSLQRKKEKEDQKHKRGSKGEASECQKVTKKGKKERRSQEKPKKHFKSDNEDHCVHLGKRHGYIATKEAARMYEAGVHAAFKEAGLV